MKTILVDAVGTLVLKGVGVYQPMQEILDEFPNPKIIVTNANDEESVEFGMHEGMPYEVFSLKHDPNKTDHKYFEILLALKHLTPEQVVYFEHNIDAVKSAESLGIKSYFYDHTKKDLAALKYFLDDNLA